MGYHSRHVKAVPWAVAHYRRCPLKGLSLVDLYLFRWCPCRRRSSTASNNP